MPIATNLRIDPKELQEFGRVMKGADKEIRKELFKAISSATKPVKEEIQASAKRTLPSSGGLGEWASRIGIRTRQAYSGRNVGVTITATLDNKKKVKGRGKGRRARKTFGAQADLRALDRGRVMHPVFGRGPLVGPQMVKPGFWSLPLQGPIAQRAKREILAAMKAAADAIAAATRKAA